MLRELTIFTVIGVSLSLVQQEKAELPVDENFLIEATILLHADEKYSNLADGRASGNVQKFAAEVAKEHEQLKQRLAEVVKDRNLGIVAGLERQTQQQADRLSKLREENFDRAYLARIALDHQRLIELCENQLKNGKDEKMTAFAKVALPALRKHLKTAEGLGKGR